MVRCVWIVKICAPTVAYTDVAQLSVRLSLSKGRNPLGELQLVGNPGCQRGLATSFQLVRLMGCGLNHEASTLLYN